MDGWDELYQAIILEHNRSPQNFGPLIPADRRVSGRNASCGDEIFLDLRFLENRIAAIQFFGEGCAISRASASLLTLAVLNRTRQEAEEIAREMVALLAEGGEISNQLRQHLGQRAALLGVRNFPLRIRCATLAWHALLDGLDGEPNDRRASKTGT
jgi:nitrogen fixation NifU-like protein